MTGKQIVLEILAWLGIGSILAAFAVVSFGLIAPDGFIYPALNGFGAILLIITSWHKQFIQLVVLNVVWLLIAALAITRFLVVA